MLQNAESMKQFEYLEKSLVSFTETVSEHAAELRQVARADPDRQAPLVDGLGRHITDA